MRGIVVAPMDILKRHPFLNGYTPAEKWLGRYNWCGAAIKATRLYWNAYCTIDKTGYQVMTCESTYSAISREFIKLSTDDYTLLVIGNRWQKLIQQHYDTTNSAAITSN
jgi:hypothetical protein